MLMGVLLLTGCKESEGGVQNNLTQEQDGVGNKDSQIQDSTGEEFQTDVESTQEDTSLEDKEIRTTMYAQANVNVRKGPGTSYDVLGKLSTNDEIIAIGELTEEWQKVLYNGEDAYISSKYLATTKKDVVKPDTPPTSSSGNQVPETTEVPDLQIYKPQKGGNGFLVVIDAGHQGRGNSDKEPNGPGSSEMKAKVTSGTSGCVSGWHEYQLNLVVSLKLKEELLARGYDVAMIRETHEINISNAIRAEAANKLNADAFIRVHANSSTDSSIYGALTICQTASNPYNADLYEECRRLSDCVLDGFVDATGAHKKSVWETDTMSGINWCEVPVTIIEMGFMSNPNEDTLMATDEYQNKMVQGMANGIDAYFEQ